MRGLNKWNKKFQNKRATFRWRNGCTGGLIQYIGTNQFPSHGVLVYIARRPFPNVDLSTLKEYDSLLEYRENIQELNQMLNEKDNT